MSVVERTTDTVVEGEAYWFVVGDSHALSIQAGADLMSLPCRTFAVGGATAVGIRNPNSTTNSVEAFRRALIPPPPGAIPVLQMGEVDCGFVICYRAEKYGESVEAQMQASVDAYFESSMN